MFFAQDEDDQDFLSPTGGSKLASLFGMDNANNQGGNESLTYTAPKEPKKKKQGEVTTQKDPTGTAVLYAVAAHCYKYVDNDYSSQGKLGIAVLANHTERSYKLLLYVSKQQQVTNASISTAFSLTILQNNYVSFYDDMRQSWTIMFDCPSTVQEFAKQIALAKATSAGSSLNTLISQDLVLGEGGELEVGDHVEMRYTGWLFQDNAIGQEFDSNIGAEKLFRFKLGKGKVIKGWEEGVLGMKKNSRRLLVVPASLGYGQSGKPPKIPGGATLIFNVEAVRVKLAKAATSGDSAEPSPAVTPASTPGPAQEPSPGDTESEGDSVTVKARTKSISDQLAHGSTDKEGTQSTPSDDDSFVDSPNVTKSEKAKLISRMAKMGQPMLPLQGAAPAEPSDSEEEPEPVAARPGLPPKPVAGAATTAPPHAAAAGQSAAQQPMMHSMAQPVGPNPTADHSTFAQPVMAPQATMVGPQMVQQPQEVHPSVFHGVQMPSQMAVYQPQMQQPFQGLYPPNQYGYPQQPFQGVAGQAGPGAMPQPAMQQPQAATPAPTPDIHTPMLLSESRQQNTEIRLSLGKMQDKMDKLYDKVESMDSSGNKGMLSLHGSLPTMEATALLHSIQKLVQDNERLKKELFEKNARIESQNEKISDLLQRNQKYVEQSHDMLEQRNDTFKTTATQSQTRLLQLEQERVQLLTELASERSQVGNIQLELANAKKKEIEIRQQLESTLSSGQTQRSDINTLKTERNEFEQRLEQATSSLREERASRKQLEAKCSALQEDSADLKSSCDSLEKNLSERKRKFSQEKKRFEEEIEELKSQHEEEITSLKEKLRKQKSSIDASTSEQVSEIEKELIKEWKDKCDRLLSTAQDKHERAIADLTEEKAQLEEKISDMDKKTAQAKAAKGEANKQVEKLQGEVDSLKAWKDKYEHLRTQAASMKDKYEDRIADLEKEKDKIIADGKKAIEKAKQSSGGAGAGGDLSKDDLVAEVKKIMNSVYHELKGEFNADKTYKGSEIHGVILGTVKSTTMKVVNDNEEDESSEEEDEEESGEEETPVVQPQEKKRQAEVASDKTVEKQVAAEVVQTIKPATNVALSSAPPEKSESKKDSKTVEKKANEDQAHAAKAAKVPSAEEQKPQSKTSGEQIATKEESVIVKPSPEILSKVENLTTTPPLKKDLESEPTKEKDKDVPQKASSEMTKETPVKGSPSSVNQIESWVVDPSSAGTPEDKANVKAADEKSVPTPKDVDDSSSKDKDSKIPDKKIETKQTTSEKKSEPVSDAPVVEKMEVSSVSASLGAAPAKPAAKKDDKDQKKEDKKDVKKDDKKKDDKKPYTGGFSLGALEGSIVMDGQALPTTDKKKPAAPSDPKKAKTESNTVPVVAPVTGAKGNPYYAEELRKAAEDAKKAQAHEHIHKAKDEICEVVHCQVNPVVAPITGDKGNPYYAEELRKAAEKAKQAEKMESTPEVVAQVSSTTSSAPPPVSHCKEDHVHAHVCGDRGNPHYAEELRKAAEAAKSAEASPKEEKVHSHVTGDKGNPYYAAELMGKKLERDVPEPPKRSPDDVLAGIESSIMSFGVVTSKEDSHSKKSKDSDNKTQQQKKDDKSAPKGKSSEKKDTKADPLFGDAKASKPADKKKPSDKKLVSDDKPLFDDGSDDESDMFGAKGGKKPDKKDDKKAAAKKPEPKKADTTKGAKKGSDSEDDSPLKPKPPPLFDDDEDDDDWMS